MLDREDLQNTIVANHLYDLHEMEDVYEVWVKKWGKENFTRMFDRILKDHNINQRIERR